MDERTTAGTIGFTLVAGLVIGLWLVDPLLRSLGI
nr:MAG TPA: hypothetical protein [Caudoviricetes sp.]